MNYFFNILLPFLFSMLIMPLGVKFFHYLDIIDHPTQRKKHVQPTPGTGGIIFFIPFILLFSFFVEPTPHIVAYLISVTFLVFIGFTDDIKPVSPYTKFFAQLLAAFALLSISQFYRNIPFFEHLPQLQFLIAILFLVGVTNAFNLIDGLDGLAAGLSIISLGTLSLFMVHSDYFPLILLIIGSVFGFLRANTFPAAIFMGDSGSYFLGFSIGTFCLAGIANGDIPSWFSLFVIFIPMTDTINVFIRRLIAKKNIFLPDSNHIHYRLLNYGISHKNTVYLLYSVQAIASFMGIGILIHPNDLFWKSTVILFLLTVQHGILIYRDDLKKIIPQMSEKPMQIFLRFPFLARGYIYYFIFLLLLLSGLQIFYSPIQSTENMIMIFLALITTFLFIIDHNAGRSANVSIGLILLAGLSSIISPQIMETDIGSIIQISLLFGVILSVFGLFKRHHIFDSPTEYLMIVVLILFALISHDYIPFSISYYLILIYLVYKILLQDNWIRKHNIIYIINIVTLVLIIIKSLP